MSIRETIERHRTGTLVISALLIVIIIGFAYRSFKKSVGSTEIGQCFTTDDGATYFVDSSSPIPPFDHHGKVAVKANVARQDTGNALQVIYMERLTPAARTVAEKIRAKSPVSAEELQQISSGIEYKAPGESQWHTFKNPMELAFWARALAAKQGCSKSGFVDPS